MKGPPITLRDRLLVFFAANPDEVLSVLDMRIKWSIRVSGSSHVVLGRMERAGLIEWKRGTGGDKPGEITAGPQLMSMAGIR